MHSRIPQSGPEVVHSRSDIKYSSKSTGGLVSLRVRFNLCATILDTSQKSR